MGSVACRLAPLPFMRQSRHRRFHMCSGFPVGWLGGASWGLVGLLWGILDLAGLLEAWRPLGVSWAPPGAILEAIDQKRGWIISGSPRRSLQMGLLGRSWGPLGALLGALGALLGPSWGPLGALLGHLGAILGPQKPIRSEKARRPKTLIFFRFLKDFGLSGASLGGSLAS